MTNPLLKTFDTPFSLPPFDLIEDHHFEEALRHGMKLQAQKIALIAESKDKPTFANTVIAFEDSGKEIRQTLNLFFNLNLARTSSTLQDTSKKMNPLLSRHGDTIKMNVQLFARFEQLWREKETLGLNEEQEMLLKKFYEVFRRNGAGLPEKGKEKLMDLNSTLAEKTLEFGQNLLQETNHNKIIINNIKELQGLPQNIIEAARDLAEAKGHAGSYLFTPNQNTYLSLLTNAENRELRKKIWLAYTQRGKAKNEKLIQEIVDLRLQKARLLGYEHYADMALEDSMAKNAVNVQELLDSLWPSAYKQAMEEYKELEKIQHEEGLESIQPYDWYFLAEQIRKKKYEVDEKEISEYFPLENVQKGIFSTCQKLFGLEFKKLNGVPLYHPDVVCYEVKESTGETVGILYMDFFARDSKQGGAWMTKYKAQQYEAGKRVAPQISIVGNFTPPSPGSPSLLTLDEVNTFFHEFGHALHGLLSNVEFESLAGTSVPRDFVELPSQLLENWAMEPQSLHNYAYHYKSKKLISTQLVEKLKQSQKFNQGFALTEYLLAAYLDLAYHTQVQSLELKTAEFEAALNKKLKMDLPILPRYKSSYFSHIFAGGYAASYYSYIYAEILDADVFDSFASKSLFDKHLADKLRTEILEKGGSREAEDMYRGFKGRNPKMEALLKRKFTTG